MDILEVLREKRAQQMAIRENAQIAYCTADGRIKEIDDMMAMITPKVEFVITADGEEPQGNQQYDLAALNGSKE